MEYPPLLNIVHRPEMIPEYAETAMTRDAYGETPKTALLRESLDIFRLQQEIAHKNGLKTTIQMAYASLFNEEAVALAKEHQARYGDEIALTLLGLPCEQFREKYKTKDFCIWMFSQEDKATIVDDGLWQALRLLRLLSCLHRLLLSRCMADELYQKYPTVTCAVATCFEGPKAYHTCNNSWSPCISGMPMPWNSKWSRRSRDCARGTIASPFRHRAAVGEHWTTSCSIPSKNKEWTAAGKILAAVLLFQFFRLWMGAGIRPPRAINSAEDSGCTGITGALPSSPP